MRPQLCENPHPRWTRPFGQASARKPPLWLHPLIRVITTTPQRWGEVVLVSLVPPERGSGREGGSELEG